MTDSASDTPRQLEKASVRLAVRAGAEQLAAAGVPSAQVDAEELAAFLLELPRTQLGMHPLMTGLQHRAYQELIEQRAQRIPLQHLIGSVTLGKATVAVGAGVFIPRVETEVLIEWAVDAIADIPEPVVVDLCTGTGIIALAIAAARPDAQVYAVEQSASALAWARRNIDTHVSGGGRAVHLRAGNVLDERLLADLDGTAHIVTANPPYVPTSTAVEPEVSDYDPHEAVFAGDDGLDLIRPLIKVAAGLLRIGGQLAMEHDSSHAAEVIELLHQRQVLADATSHNDLAGRPRFVTARRVSLPRRTPGGV